MTIMETDVVETTTTTEELNIEVGNWGMDPSLKQRWVTALRSGKYQQCYGVFQREDSFCVLGVLCVVAGEPTYEGLSPSNFGFVRKVFPNNEDYRRLYDLNDAGTTFPELADYIEENL